MKGSPVDPNRLYASQTSGWFGQMMQRSNDGGKTWEAVGNKFVYDGVPGTHQWYDGTPHPWEFKRVWHLEPSLTDPDTVYAGAEDAAVVRSRMAGRTGKNWLDCADTVRDRSGSRGRRDVLAHHHSGCQRSEADVHRIWRRAFRSDDSGRLGRPINQGLRSQYIPTRRRRWDTVCTTLQCISRGRELCSCRSTGM